LVEIKTITFVSYL